ncbi:hypothetical protein [Anoxybacillus sp. FSL W8-1294]|uniref:hypothetical protein n=1 Tax=Anoxybacillus sp. FSL W8-1294 TaxID=2954655 RepID=UPI0030D1CF09
MYRIFFSKDFLAKKKTNKEKALALAREGRKRAETTFSFANTAEQLKRVYITICQ